MDDAALLQPGEIIATLNRHRVRYVVIGGLAAVLHGSPLRTDDADICPARCQDNLDRLARALAELDARIALPDDPRGVPFPQEGAFLGRVQTWNLITRCGRLDLTFRPSGTGGYDDLKRRAVHFDLGEGLVAPVASLLDVIRSKEAASRDKDRRALPVLRQLLERLERQRRDPGGPRPL